MWWILILTIIGPNGQAVTVVEDITDERLCVIAGKAWKGSIKSYTSVRGYYVCARRT